MVESTARMETMRDMFLYGNHLYSWTLSEKLEHVYSNCPEAQFFYHVFLCNGTSLIMKEHFEREKKPLIITDEMGLAWIAVSHRNGERTDGYLLAGPFFSVEASQTYIAQMCAKKKYSSALVSELANKLKSIPTILLSQAVRYTQMLYYCVNAAPIAEGDVALESSGEKNNPQFPEEAQVKQHGTWEMEQELFGLIRNGVTGKMPEVAAKFAGANIGVSTEDGLRQIKNNVIIFTALACREAIHGGMSVEGSYNLADYYIKRVEESRRVDEVQKLSIEMFENYARRVHQCRQNTGYSQIVAAAMEYIETHIMEKINLDDMAKEIGYTAYYISDKFRKETRTSINTYIKKKKIDIAKQFLKDGRLSYADISERLGFSSPSYFTAVFKKETGVIPSDYVSGKCENKE